MSRANPALGVVFTRILEERRSRIRAVRITAEDLVAWAVLAQGVAPSFVSS